jgi:hypothetical protein
MNDTLIILLASLALCPAAVQAQDHGHLNVGAVAQVARAKLTFDNGPDFTGDYVKTLTYTNAGKFANLYHGNITLTALHATDPFGEATPGAPAPGAFIVAEIVSVLGPEGGAFQFWETNSTTTPAASISTGTTNSTFRFELSDALLGAGEPGADPFGHIHGRRFTVTRPGLYTVGFRAYDVSKNGPSGGPIHTPSDVTEIHFQGDVGVTKVQPDTGGVRITFGAMAGYAWQLEAKESLSETRWTPIPAPVIGTDKLVEMNDERAAGFSRFYRVTGTPVAP